MQAARIGWCGQAFVLVLIAGCQAKPAANGANPTAAKATGAADEEIKASLAKLGPNDRALAEKQQYCAVMPQVRLGEMGTPIKLTVNGQAMFVCCHNCVRSANDDPATALAQLKEIQARAAAAPGK
jgi:hypothetical protein